jgi:hypothetical protein
MNEIERQSSQPAGGGDQPIADGTAGTAPHPTPTSRHSAATPDTGEPAIPRGRLSTPHLVKP